MVDKFHNFKDFLDFYCSKNNKNIYYLSNKSSEAIKYNELKKIFYNFEIFLEKNNVQKNSKILVILDNSKELLLTYLSIIYNYRIFVPLNPNSGIDEINYIIKKTRPKFLISNKNYSKIIKKLPEIPNFLFNKNNFNKNFRKMNRKKKVSIRKYKAKNFIAQILFTSGSTGNPKGVVLSHKAMLTNLYDINESLNIKKDKQRFLSVTPIYHNNGQFIPSLLPFIINGSTISISPDTSLLNFWPTCKKYKINYSSVMATHINYFNTLNSNKINSLKSIFCGGAKLDIKSQKLFEKKFNTKVLCNYGLTETSSIASTESINNKNYFYGSVGKTLKSNSIKIMNKSGKYGEIWIKGENLFSRYYNDKYLTKKTFNKSWFKTGDIGYKNKNNFLFIKDRIDNMIIVSGENIYPSEIENHIYKFKGINLGIVSSIPDRLTQNKMIFLYESKNLINYNTFYNFFKSKISRHKIPKKIIHVSEIGIKEIPKASNKKILRKKVKDLLKKKLFK